MSLLAGNGPLSGVVQMAAVLPLPEGADTLSAAGSVVYLAVLLLLFPFGLHRLYLVWLRFRRPKAAGPGSWEGPLPRVTVQVPLYNEANVAARAVDAACRLDYPPDLLEVQILDDSDDETSDIVAARVSRWRREGVDVKHVRRGSRKGFKAGALATGTELAHGNFFLVLDADFVPPRDLVRRLLPSFADPEVGMVQAAWEHLNAEVGWLTRAQALLLDAHFAVEHEARFRAGLFFNFNGTAGMWRRSCLEEVGGWQGDTLTEDLDLSYRAQLAGWRGVYRDDVRVPGELPPTLRALEVQQERWAEGGLQTARKLLPEMWRSGESLAVKTEATAHLLGHLAHPLTLLLGVALAGAGFASGDIYFVPDWFHALALSLAVFPFVLHYGLAARIRGASLTRAARRVAEGMTLGIGLGVPLVAAVARGALGPGEREFRRTPKRGTVRLLDYALAFRPVPAAVRTALGLALLAAAAVHVAGGSLTAVPFTLLFAAGYLFTAFATARTAGSSHS